MSQRRLDQIASSIRVLIHMSEKYSNECTSYNEIEKSIVKDFIQTLKVFELQKDPIKNSIYREELRKEIQKFLSKYSGKTPHLKYPFLWFTCTFFERLRGMLISERTFFPILLEIMRKVTLHLKSCISLKDKDIWEKMQYLSNTKVFNFLHTLYGNELDILKSLYSLLENGLSGLNPRRINDVFRNHFTRGNISYKQLISTLIDLVYPKWSIEFNTTSFDLEWYFIKVKLLKSEKLGDIFGLSDNSIMNSSYIYQLGDTKEITILGRLVIPKNKFNELIEHLSAKEDKKLIKIYSIKKIENYSESVSYNHYIEDRGWTFDDNKELGTKPSYSTNLWNTDWHYLQEENPLDYIKTFFKFIGNPNYQYLVRELTEVSLKKEKNILFYDHTLRMYKMYEQGVIKLNLVPFGLLNSYSLDSYLLTLPPSHKNQNLSKLLSLVPYSYVYYLEDNSIRLTTYLDKSLLNYLKKNFAYEIEKVVFAFKPKTPELNSFNPETMTWNFEI